MARPQGHQRPGLRWTGSGRQAEGEARLRGGQFTGSLAGCIRARLEVGRWGWGGPREGSQVREVLTRPKERSPGPGAKGEATGGLAVSPTSGLQGRGAGGVVAGSNVPGTPWGPSGWSRLPPLSQEQKQAGEAEQGGRLRRGQPRAQAPGDSPALHGAQRRVRHRGSSKGPRPLHHAGGPVRSWLPWAPRAPPKPWPQAGDDETSAPGKVGRRAAAVPEAANHLGDPRQAHGAVRLLNRTVRTEPSGLGRAVCQVACVSAVDHG